MMNDQKTSTTAFGPMRTTSAAVPMTLAALLSTGTSAFGAMPAAAPVVIAYRDELTVSEELAARYEITPARAIAELRRLSGLSWEQLSTAFATSRRALHFWASGKPMKPANEERLHRVLTTLRRIDRGTSAANRSALLAADETTKRPLDLLAEQRYDEIISQLGLGTGRPAGPNRNLTSLAERRQPPSPETLMAANETATAPTSGHLLGATPIRKPEA